MVGDWLLCSVLLLVTSMTTTCWRREETRGRLSELLSQMRTDMFALTHLSKSISPAEPCQNECGTERGLPLVCGGGGPALPGRFQCSKRWSSQAYMSCTHDL